MSLSVLPPWSLHSWLGFQQHLRRMAGSGNWETAVRLGSRGQPAVPGVLVPFIISPTFLLSSVQAWSTLALSEPAFIKLLWLEPLKTHRGIFMFNLLGFFFFF